MSKEMSLPVIQDSTPSLEVPWRKNRAFVFLRDPGKATAKAGAPWALKAANFWVCSPPKKRDLSPTGPAGAFEQAVKRQRLPRTATRLIAV
jgi:hypothetical protein